jgi:hypothetical protein
MVPPRLQTILVNLAIAAFGLAPVAISLGTGVFASEVGCELGEGSVHRCLFRGEDIGHTLYVLGMAWVYLLVTLPLSLTLAVVYNIFNRRRRKAATADRRWMEDPSL